MYYQLDETWHPFSNLMLKHVYNVLLICSEYDRFMLEEDGRVEEELYKEYTSLGLSNPPKIHHTSSEAEALEMLKEQPFDLVISMLDLGSGRVEALAEQVKNFNPELPFIALAPSPDHRKVKVLKGEDCPYIDYIFYWLGNPSVFLAMVKLIEDKINIDHDTSEADVQVIIFVEDSVRFISSYLPQMYTLLIEQNRVSILEALNEWGTKLRMRGRPKIILAKDYNQAMEIYNRYRQNVLGVITDLTFPSPWGREMAGDYLSKAIRQDNPECPILIQSTDRQLGMSVAKENDTDFVWKLSPDRYHELAEHFRSRYDFGPFHFRDPETGAILATVKTMRELQHKMGEVPVESFIYHVRRNDFSRWLRAQSLYQLASRIKPITLKPNASNAEEMRSFIITTIKEYRKERTRGTIAEFNRDSYDETLLFTRLGKGSLGGKGRGLAFIAMEMKAASFRKRYPDVYVSIPRTVVISTEIFDQFLEKNNFWPSDFVEKTDDQVLTMFLQGELPLEFHEDLKKIASVIVTPMSIRSSSLLEDSHFQPFAGVYQTSMIANVGTLEERLEDLEKAVKTVWASTYFNIAKEYLKRTGHAIEEEKMAVIIQQITGSDHEGLWFPNLSGVARSLDYYPAGSRTAEDGIGMLAFGMGKTVVDEGAAFRFCPGKPQVPVNSLNGKSASQRKFYALDRSVKFDPHTDIDNLVQLDLSKAYKWPNAIKGMVSVMTPYGYMSENINDSGFKLLTFNGVIKYGMLPVAKIVDELLKLGSQTMSEPVEIEFAVNTEHDGRPDFSVLQIRPISNTDRFEDIEITDEELDNAIISCSKVMGNGKAEGLRDIICVKPELFKRAEMVEMAQELEMLNHTSENQYVLVAAGRLGSSDSWLGIPCSWSQISNAHVIVETGLKEIQAEPSEGTHFFQNVTSLGCLYLTNNPLAGDGKVKFEDIIALPIVRETKHFVHVRSDNELTVKADGLSGKAIVSLS